MVEIISKQDNIYKSLFEDSPISHWEMDWSAIKDYLDNLRSTGVIDYREYFENNPTVVSECLSLIKIIDVNNATLELYKANNKKEFLNELNRISTEESIKAFRGALIDIAEGKTTFKGENLNLTFDGDEIYTEIKMTIPAGYEQSLKRVFLSITDITEHRNNELKLREFREMYRTLVENAQKEAKRKLKESEEKFKTITSVAQDAIIQINNKGIIIYWNRAAERIFGYESQEIIGKDLHAVIIPKRYRSAYLKGMKLFQKTVRWEWYSSKNQKTYDLIDTPLRNPDGTISKLEIFRDITKLKKGSENIKQAYSKLNQIFNTSTAMIMINKDFDIINVNDTYSSLFHLKKEDVINKKCYDIWSGQFCNTPKCTLKQVLEGKDQWQYEKEKELSDGSKISTFMRATPLRSLEGEIIGVVENITDISELKQAEQKLKVSEDRYKSLFNSSMIGIMTSNQDGTLTMVNPAAASILGYDSAEEMIGLHVGKFYLDSIQREAFVQRLGIRDFLMDFEATLKKKDGKYINTMVNATVHKDREGKFLRGELFFKDITERKKAEQKLKESEQRLRSFMDSSTDGFILFDSKLNYIDVNRVTAKILGLDKEDLIGKNMLDIAPYLKETGRYDKYMDVIKTGEPFSTDDDIFHTSDRNLDIYLSVRAFKVGKNLGITFTDVTERKKTEKIITDLAKFPSENPNPVLRATKEKIIYINEAGEKLFNIIEGESVPLSLLDKVKEVFSLNEIERLEIEHNNQVYSYFITPVEVEDYVNIYGRDITERKKAEEKIRESEVKFRTFTEQSFTGISIVQDNFFKYVNQQLAQIFAYTTEELLNLQQGDFIKLVHPEDRDLVIDQINKRQFGDLDVINNYQLRGIKKNGDVIWLDVFGKTINYKGRPASYGTLIDITEKKKIEEIKSKLLTRFSHEFKTPLVSIHGYIDLLIEKYSESFDSETMSLLKEAKEGSTRLKHLINLFIESSKLEEKLVKVNLVEDNLYDLIKSCLNELKGLIRLRAHTINLDLREDLTIIFDREKLKEVISNLLVNSVKYTPPDGNIEIKSRIEDNFIVISVKDNGIGLTEDEKLQLFTQFGKIERYGQGWNVLSEGSGMGLYISKELIKLHGGKIWAESGGRNQGSTFYLSLPLKR